MHKLFKKTGSVYKFHDVSTLSNCVTTPPAHKNQCSESELPSSNLLLDIDIHTENDQISHKNGEIFKTEDRRQTTTQSIYKKRDSVNRCDLRD
jgi:hypothetical protein